MTQRYFGQFITTATVQAAPAPTAQVFTVDDASSFKVGQIIRIPFGGGSESQFISSISSNEITTVDPFVTIPSAGDEVQSAVSLITNQLLNSGLVYNADDVADIKTIDVSNIWPDTGFKIKGVGIYRYDPNSSETADDDLYIDATPSGQFVKEYSFNPGGETDDNIVNQPGHGFSDGDPVWNNNGTYELTDGSDHNTLRKVYIVTQSDTDNFVPVDFGVHDIGTHGYTIGDIYYVDRGTPENPVSDGSITNSKPDVQIEVNTNGFSDEEYVGTGFYLPLFRVVSATEIEVLNDFRMDSHIHGITFLNSITSATQVLGIGKCNFTEEIHGNAFRLIGRLRTSGTSSSTDAELLIFDQNGTIIDDWEVNFQGKYTYSGSVDADLNEVYQTQTSGPLYDKALTSGLVDNRPVIDASFSLTPSGQVIGTLTFSSISDSGDYIVYSGNFRSTTTATRISKVQFRQNNSAKDILDFSMDVFKL